ncbi:MAG TPA: VOC family protein [Pseudobdellovibrionaceae bacterium]|jgi:predicted 3-demethylubiquinone-9 3-methyltransferase (glyoxalase superfamily)
MQKINPCLWFDNQAEEAAKFYTSIFESSKIGKVSHYGEAAAEASGQAKGSVMTLEFELEGGKFLALNGEPNFKFTPAVSFFVWCETESEIDALWGKLFAGGSAIWELKKYPWAEKYGWCVDKYGVSWQLMLAEEKRKIAPALLFVNKLYGKGEDAINFYLSVFENSKIKNIHRDPNTNAVMHALFLLEGQEFVLMEGEGSHEHVITPAISFMVNCKTQEEVDRYWEKLSHGGTTNQCGWLTDQFGVSWQIVPTFLVEMWSDLPPEKSEKVMKAMLKMQKLDIAVLTKASL